MVHIITHNDLDGYSAGYVVLQHFGKENCTIEHLNYDREPYTGSIIEGDTVVITDYSLSNDQYRHILALVGDDGDVIWCDHHISAIDRYRHVDDIWLQGIRSTKWCGAALTWFYFNDFDAEEVEDMPYGKLVEKLPYWLRLVDAWDAWKTDSDYRDLGVKLNTALTGNISIDSIDKIANDIGELYTTIRRGEICVEYKNSWAKLFRDRYMFKVNIPGQYFGVDGIVHAAVMTLGCGSSEYFGDVLDSPGIDVGITQCFNGTGWCMSFYSTKSYIDCSLAAKMFGGGGHKSAAGCVINGLYPPLSKDDTVLFNKK